MEERKWKDEPQKLLVVDDNLDAAASLCELLKIWGHHVWMAHNGPDAIQTAQEIQPDAVLLDISLPGMSGYEVAARLHRDPALEGTWLIAMTGYGREEDRRRAEAAGFKYHFTKPINLAQLRRTLASRWGEYMVP